MRRITFIIAVVTIVALCLRSRGLCGESPAKSQSGISIEDAIGLAKESSRFEAWRGITVLYEQYPDDPRTERALREVAKGTEKRSHEYETTSAYAERLLTKILADRQEELWLAGATNAAARLALTRKILAASPGWDKRRTTTCDDKAKVVAMQLLVRRSLKENGGDAVDLAVRYYGFITKQYAAENGHDLMKALRHLGREEAMSRPGLLQRAATGGDTNWVTLLSGWLGEATDEVEMSMLVHAIGGVGGGREELLSILKNGSPQHVRYAAGNLSVLSPDRETLAALRDAAKRLEALRDVDPKYRRVVLGMAQYLAVDLGLSRGRPREYFLERVDTPIPSARFRIAVIEMIRTYPDQRTLVELRNIAAKLSQARGAEENAEFITRMIRERLAPPPDATQKRRSP